MLLNHLQLEAAQTDILDDSLNALRGELKEYLTEYACHPRIPYIRNGCLLVIVDNAQAASHIFRNREKIIVFFQERGLSGTLRFKVACPRRCKFSCNLLV